MFQNAQRFIPQSVRFHVKKATNSKQKSSKKKKLMMKNKLTLLIIITVALISCEKDELDYNGEIKDGFCIVADDKVVLDHNDFEYYDYSSHLIYMKDSKSFVDDIESIGEFKIFANKKEIYTGQTVPGFHSFLLTGPIISTHPSGYGDYIIPIEFIKIIDTLGNVPTDLREDERIIEALKKYNQFHAGLSCEIISVQYLSATNVSVELTLKNNDSFSYYYLDPDKMGSNLFHYFTNGLYIKDFSNHKSYTHGTEHFQPEPWNSWSSDWLSIINGNESKVITINYDSFEQVPSGEYNATFEFPGLSYQVGKNELVQENGKIWLGEINMIKDIKIE